MRRHPAPPGATQFAAVPRELEMVSLPPYRIAPPDELTIEVVRVAPKPPFKIQPQDILRVMALGTFLGEDIAGFFQVQDNGHLYLGASYGSVPVADLTLQEAEEKIRERLVRVVAREQDVRVVVALAQSLAIQQISGQHLVSQDGQVNLGIYGKVFVTGMTLEEAKSSIEEHLSRYLSDPVVSVTVSQFNSQYYYIVLEGGVRTAGVLDQIVRFPITGGETVLDALAQVNGVTQFQSKNIWIARPAEGSIGGDQILPVRFAEITAGGGTATNYQIMPGDRIFIAEDKLWAAQDFIDKILRPFERMVAFALLGTQTIQAINRLPQGVNSSFLL